MHASFNKHHKVSPCLSHKHFLYHNIKIFNIVNAVNSLALIEKASISTMEISNTRVSVTEGNDDFFIGESVLP